MGFISGHLFPDDDDYYMGRHYRSQVKGEVPQVFLAIFKHLNIA